MKRTPLRRVSVKTKARNLEWADIKSRRIKSIVYRYGFKRCELCGTRGHIDDKESFFFLDPHHVNWNRADTFYQNCCITHRICHTSIPRHIKTWEALMEYVKTDEFKKAISNYIALDK